MNQIQKLKFHSVDEFLEYLPVHEREMVDRLRAIIRDCMTEGKEKLAYNVPYYYLHSRVCFIWPASVPWGNVKADGVLLGFCNGHMMRDELNYLEKGNRKQVYVKTFTSISEIDLDLIRTYLFEALNVDEQLHQQKRSKKKL